jgi:hypothetical protein
MADRVLQVGNVFIAGHPVDLFFRDRPSGDPRERILERYKPSLVLADKPQDLGQYAVKVRHGESVDHCASRIENETIMESGIFRTDCMPFVNACYNHGAEEIFFVDLPSTVRNVVPLYLDDRFGDQTTRTRVMSLRLQEIRANRSASKNIVMFVDQLLLLNIYENLLNWRHDNKPETYEAIKTGLYDSLELVLGNHLQNHPIPGVHTYEKSGRPPDDVFDLWADDYLKILDRAIQQNRGGARVDNDIVQGGMKLSTDLFKLSFQMFKLSAPNRNDISRGKKDYMARLVGERKKLGDMLQDGRMRTEFLATMDQLKL